MEEKIIDELYYGRIDPSSKGIIRGSEYDKTNREFVRLHDEFNSKLKDGDKIIFENIIEKLMKLNSIDNMDKFKEGFTLGLRITCESFFDKSENLKEI